MQYDFSLHASTLNTGSSLSFDSSFPIFDYSLIGTKLTIEVIVYNNASNATPAQISQLSGYAFQPLTVSLPPDISSLAVSIEPPQGVAITTSFIINCTGGYTQLTPMGYSIGYLTNGAVYTNQSSSRSLSSSCFWLIRKRKMLVRE